MLSDFDIFMYFLDIFMDFMKFFHHNRSAYQSKLSLKKWSRTGKGYLKILLHLNGVKVKQNYFLGFYYLLQNQYVRGILDLIRNFLGQGTLLGIRPF